jgi:hypothetical protein
VQAWNLTGTHPSAAVFLSPRTRPVRPPAELAQTRKLLHGLRLAGDRGYAYNQRMRLRGGLWFWILGILGLILAAIAAWIAMGGTQAPSGAYDL